MSDFIKKSGQRWMAASINEAVKNSHVNTLVLYASIENVALIADNPNFFSKHWKILPMCRPFVYTMFLYSGEGAASFLVPEGFSSLLTWDWSFCSSFLVAWRTFSCRLTWEFSTSDFESPSIQFPGACPTLFLSSSFPGLTRDPKLGEEISSLHWLCITR